MISCKSSIPFHLQLYLLRAGASWEDYIFSLPMRCGWELLENPSPLISRQDLVSLPVFSPVIIEFISKLHGNHKVLYISYISYLSIYCYLYIYRVFVEVLHFLPILCYIYSLFFESDYFSISYS